MALHPGSRLGAYEILTQIGVGGMGEVYRARDTRLGRDVAIKVLPSEVAAVPERLARFEREAQVLASLNHPNIAHIHGVDDSSGAPALVMEFVEGSTLAERITKGPIPVDEALSIAKQIADALEAAHERGIIHRDLKPANIKVRTDGAVKVLDFGLAKAFDTTPTTAHPGVTPSPTITSPAIRTGIGVLLGTAAYMSPEQAKGRTADKRSDVWAFGCVLYELLSGTRAFGGDDLPLVLAAVLTQPPDWSALPGATPVGVRRLLRQCLEKDLRRRLQAIGDARVQLEEVLAGTLDEVLPAPVDRLAPRVRRLVLPVAALAISLVSGGLVWVATRSSAAPQRVSRLNITPQGAAALTVGVSRDVAITSDGSRLVYVGANGTTLFVRPLDQLEATPIVRGGAPRHPFVSPDGLWVGFFDGGLTLKKVPMTGGPAVLIARLDSFERGATWSPDGTIVFATQSTALGLQRVSADGGTPTVLTRPTRERGEAGHAWPEMLPDGHAILYSVLPTAGGLDAVSLAVLDLRTNRSTTLLGGGSDAQYAPSGYLLYGMSGGLRAVGFDSAGLKVAGSGIPVVPQVATTPFGGVDAVMARDGTLVYVTGAAGAGASRALVWVDRQGRETPLASSSSAYYFPRVSRDGTRIAVNAVVEQNSDIWAWDVTRATLTRVTSDPAQEAFPIWMPDGRRVLFGSNRFRAFNLFSQAADGTGMVERLTESLNPQYPSDISPDHQRVVFTEMSSTTGYDVMALTLNGAHQVLPLVQTSFDERNGIVSPDARWLAYEANDTGAFEIYVRPSPDVNGGHWRVSTTGGTQPLWAPGGRELFYFAPDGALMKVDVATGSVWMAGPPIKVLEGRYVVSTGGNVPRNYDIAPDGQRFLMLKMSGNDTTSAPAQIVVVEHFDEELKRLLPRK